ncbi:hypothetical protein [Streptomyces milbemycinicus]|uniref:hypothetical protein n=1 Tax=Streptomyces milbemycinicus TaxID=476552 RepID=UPI0033EB6113
MGTVDDRAVAGASFASYRSRQLHSLSRAHRALWAVILAPFALFPLVVVTIGQAGGDPVSNPIAIVLYGLAAGCLPFAVVLIMVMQVWARRSYDHRHGGMKYRPVDWSDSAWERVRAAFVSAGLDPDRLRAVSVWDQRANLRARHIPRPTPGRLGRLADWTVPRNNLLYIAGAVSGIAAAVFQNDISEFTDTPVFMVFIACALVAMAPFAWRHGSRQVRLNLRDPDNIVIIPSHWRPQLRREPKATVRLLHEISHVRHGDPGMRRLLAVCPGIGQFLVFVDAATVSSLTVNAGVVAAGFVATVTWGILSVRRAARLIPLVHELRADTEACRDAETTAHMVAFLQELQARNSSEEKALRLASLTNGPQIRALRRRLVVPVTLMAGCVLTVISTAVGELTGVLTISV